MIKIKNLFAEKRKFFFGLMISLILIFFDQISKLYLINNVLKEQNSFIKIANFLNFTLVFNRGIAFGIFNTKFFVNFMPTILLIINSIIIVSLIRFMWKNDKYIIPFSIIIAGGTGNIIDRIIHGYVIDFLDFHLGKYSYPVFNVADCYVCIGLAVFIFLDWKNI